MPYVFGYGSLMNRVSAEKTLCRSLCHEDLHCATLQGYQRSWTARGYIHLQETGGLLRLCDALFLDLSLSPGHSCNGVAVKVSRQELHRLDIREQGYERCMVDLEFDDGARQAGYVYVVPDHAKQIHGVIPLRYKQIVDEALALFPAEFAARFWQTTRPSQAQLIEGEYVFADHAQNQAAGRYLSGKNGLAVGKKMIKIAQFEQVVVFLSDFDVFSQL